MVTFIIALFTGYPVAWLLSILSLGFAALGIFLGDQFGFDTFLMTSWAKFSGVVDRFDAIMSNWVLVSLPMFVYMGLMLDRSGVADTMMRNFVKVFGGIRGGLGLTVIVIGILLAASTGLVLVVLVVLLVVVVFVAGFFLDWFEIVLIILPLLAPVIKLAGLDMTWFLILVALMLQTSFLTPPVGFSLLYLKGAVPKGVTIRDIYIGVIPFVLLQMAMVALCFAFPQMILWLPQQMYGGG